MISSANSDFHANKLFTYNRLNIFSNKLYSSQSKGQMKEETSIGKRTITQAEKKDLMWNIIEPGDPYDIRKSMIARLPGQTKFMGPHLELVCLLQAAEIERLCLFLEEYKVKIRQSERLELDRHSYQIQIKELSEELADQASFKRENEKLKEYIRKQTIELEQLQKQQNNTGLTTKYENCLRQIHTLIQQKDQLEETNKRVCTEISNLKQLNKFNQLAKARQLEVLSKALQEMNEATLQSEQRYRQQSEKWGAQKRQLEAQLGAINKNHSQVLQNLRDLEGASQALKRELEKAKYEAGRSQQYKKTFKEYEERFVKVAEEIDRLNNVLKEKSRLLNEEYLRSKQLSETVRLKDEELAQNELTINELQRSTAILQRQQREAVASLGNMEQNKIIIKSYEAKLQQFSLEVQRLSNIILKKQAEIEELKQKNTEYEKNMKFIDAYERQVNEYKIKYGEIIKKITDSEIQNGRLSQEIERLNCGIEKALEQKNLTQLRSKNYESQFQNLQGTIATLSSQIEKKCIGRQCDVESGYLGEIDRLNNIISESKQLNIQNEEKIGFYLREIKLLESQLRQKEGYSKLFRSIYDSRQQLKGAALSSQNREEYINDLRKRTRLLELELKNASPGSPKRSSSEQNRQRPEPEQGEGFKTPQDEIIEKLKDELLSREIQNSRLSSINEQLREMVDSYKRKMQQSPFASARAQQKSPGSFSPEPSQKQITKMEKEPARQRASKGQIQIQQQTPIHKQQDVGKEPEYHKDTSEKYQLSLEIQPHRVLDKSKQKRQSAGKEQDYKEQRKVEQRSREYQYLIKQQSQAQKDRQKKKQPFQQWQQMPQASLEIIPGSAFREYLEQSQQKQAVPKWNDLTQKYKQLLDGYQKTGESHERLKTELRNLREQKQLNQNYINLLTDKIQLLNNQISQLKQRIDPRLYQQNQQGQLNKSYSLLLQKYNNAVFDNDTLRSKIRQAKEGGSQHVPDPVNEGELRRLSAENEELKSNCARFSQYYSQILLVNDQLERVNSILLERDREIQSKQALIRDLEAQQLSYQYQLTEMEAKLRDLTGQSNLNLPFTLQGESDKLSRELARLQRRNSDLERIVKGYELEPTGSAPSNEERRKWHSQLQSMSQQVARLNSLLANRKKDFEVEQNKSLARNVQENKKSSRASQDSSKATKYEEKIVLLSQEIERLNGLLRARKQSQLSLKCQFADYQEAAKKQLTSYALETDRLNSQISKLRDEVEHTRRKDQNGKFLPVTNAPEYESKLIELSKQVERLNRILISSRQQNSELSAKDSKYRSQIQRLNNSLRLKVEESIMAEGQEKLFVEQRRTLMRQIQEKTRDYDALDERGHILEQDNARLKHDLTESQKRIKGLYEQLQLLQRAKAVSKGEDQADSGYSISQVVEKNRFLSAQIERLNEVAQKQRQDLSDLRLSLADEASLQKRLSEDLALFVVLFAQIEALRKRLGEQEEEVEHVRRTSIASRKV